MNRIRWVWIYTCISTEGSIQLADLAQMHLWDCIECVPFDTAWHWPGLQSPINCISDALGWLLRSHHRVSPPCFNLRQDEGSRSWWDQKVQRWMWHVRSLRFQGVVYLSTSYLIWCAAGAAEASRRGQSMTNGLAQAARITTTLSWSFVDCWQWLTGWGYSMVFCVESIVFSDSSTPLCEAPKLNLKLMSEMWRNVSKCEN